MAHKKQNKPRYNVATAIGPQQVIVVDFKFASDLTFALKAIEHGDPGYAMDFLGELYDSFESQDQSDQEPTVAVPRDKE